jgi:hypothetical protein
VEFWALSKINSSTAVIRDIQRENNVVPIFGFKLKPIHELALLVV